MKSEKSHISTLLRAGSTVFSFKDISLLWRDTNKNAVKSRINYYVKTGELYPIRRGFYGTDKDYNRFELAGKIYTPAYISLETVLAREGVIFQYYERIFAISYLTREIKCDGQTYDFKKIKNSVLTNMSGIKKENNYFVATRERAFLDVVYLYKNYHFDNLNSIDWDACYKLDDIYKSQALIARLNSYYKDSKNA